MYDFVFNWQSTFDTGVGNIDVQHRQLFKIGRDIEQLIIKKFIGVTDREMLEVIRELREYTNYHYYTEEKMMEECNYPDAKNHKMQHQNNLEYIKKLNLPQIKKDPMKGFKEIKENIQSWIFMHILVEDFKLANYYVEWDKTRKENKLEKEKEEFELKEGKYGYIVCELDISNVYLSKNQSRKGHVIVEIKDSKTDLLKLLPLERNGYFADLVMVSKAVKKVFGADDFDYVCRESEDYCIHFDVIPKYRESTDYTKTVFDENEVLLDASQYSEMVDKLRKELIG